MYKTVIKIFSLLVERFSSVSQNKIAFVIKRTVPFSGSIRIAAEVLLSQGLHELVIFKDGPLDAECLAWRKHGVRVYESMSWQALFDLHSSAVVVLGHSGRDAFLTRRKPGRKVINLWHGVAIKRIEHLMPVEKESWSYKAWNRRRLMRVNSRVYDAMVASSMTDRLTNALAFGLDLDKVHVTGLPRFDYLSPDYCFSSNLRADVDCLDAMLAGRRMVLYAPTFRERGASALALLEPSVLERLKEFLRSNNLVLGIRPHPYDQKALEAICDGQWIIDLRPDAYAEPAIPLRAASALVVDYSSIWIDYLLLGRPIIGFMPDLEQYATQERGFIYDLPAVFPGPMLREWGAVMAALQALADSGFAVPVADKKRYLQAENLFLPAEHLRFKSTAACMELFFGSGVLPQVPQRTDASID